MRDALEAQGYLTSTIDGYATRYLAEREPVGILSPRAGFIDRFVRRRAQHVGTLHRSRHGFFVLQLFDAEHEQRLVDALSGMPVHIWREDARLYERFPGETYRSPWWSRYI